MCPLGESTYDPAMKGEDAGYKPVISTIIPIPGKEVPKASLGKLLGEISKVMNLLRIPYEMIVVYDKRLDPLIRDEISRINPAVGDRGRVISIGHPKWDRPSALIAGVHASKGRMLVFYDASLDVHPMNIPLLIRELGKADAAILSRNLQGSKVIYPSLLRKIGSFLFRNAVNLLTGIRVSDTQIGTKAIWRDVLLDLLGDLTLRKSETFDIELITALLNKGHTISEIPANYEITTRERVPIYKIPLIIYDLLKMRVKLAKGDYRSTQTYSKDTQLGTKGMDYEPSMGGIGVKLAVIPAAGRGSRLSPLTTLLPKPLLPLYDDTVIGNILGLLSRIGVQEIYVIVGYEKDKVISWVKYLNEDRHYGFKLNFLEQKKLSGIADAIYLTRDYISEPFLVILGDEVYFGELPASITQRLLMDKAAVVEGVVEERDLSVLRRTCSIVLDPRDWKVLSAVEKPKIPPSWYRGTGIYAFSPDIYEYIMVTPISAIRNEREITETIELAARDERAYGVLLPGRSINVNTIEDLYLAWSIKRNFS